MRRIFFAFGVAAFLATSACPGFAQDNVPEKFRDLYQGLDRKLDEFDLYLATHAPARNSPVIFSAGLMTANSHRGLQLLKPEAYEGTLLELSRLQELGVKAVALSIAFPILDRGFYTDPAQWQGILDFYKRISGEIHKRGLKLIVKTGAMFSKGGFSDQELQVRNFYRHLKLNGYLDGRRDMAVLLARELSPDYLSVATEPDTEAEQSGKSVNTPENFLRLTTHIQEGLRSAGLTGMKVGAGIGSWQPRYKEFVRFLSRQAALDYIDIHVYPVNLDFLERVLTISDMARQGGKAVAMSEAWLYKSRLGELASGFVAPEMFGRDAYDFWQPLDTKFIHSMVRLAKAREFEFFSPFWTKYFFAYLHYDDVKQLNSRQLAKFSSIRAAEAIVAGDFTELAGAYSELIKPEE